MSEAKKELPPFKIEAVVKFNHGEGLVLNRNPNYVYRRVSPTLLLAEDGPFCSVYGFQAPQGRFKAFAGRKFDIPLEDGTVEKAHGQWWDCGYTGKVQVIYKSKASLEECYVFAGALADPIGLAALREEYTGCVYPYSEYDTLLKYPILMRKYLDLRFDNSRKVSNLIKNVKALAAENRQLKAGK